jgi:hypothetical protein
MRFLQNYLLRIKAAQDYLPGSVRFLQALERDLGGLALDVERKRISRFDTHSKRYLEGVGMTGGDRMFYHGYAKHYSKSLQILLKSRTRSIVVVEIGILKGTGLGIWSILFPNARIIGLDIDVSHVKGNLSNLKDRGAFVNSEPELYEFDQFLENRNLLNDILNGQKIDLIIDDGEHSSAAIMKTLESVQAHLSKEFLYFVEDNRLVASEIRRVYPDWKVKGKDQFTIISQRN